jgi:RimJ/RimL family protein N-acetyltransferase
MKFMVAPAIETARLRLRAHRVDDFDNCAAMWGDPQVTRFIGGKPSTREETWGRLVRYAGHWQMLGYGYWLVEEKSSGRFVGECGFADMKRDMVPSLDGMPEAGWALASWAHGQGFASEAVTAMMAWGAAHFGTRTTACIIAPDNVPSIKVAEKCGYREVARTTYKGAPTIVFHRAA